MDASLNDQTSSWNLKNTFALALREGFQDWAKFGLTAFVTFEKRRFRLASQVPGLDYGPDGRQTLGKYINLLLPRYMMSLRPTSEANYPNAVVAFLPTMSVENWDFAEVTPGEVQ